jgi:DNA-binding transcriptional ArsR family regulator
MTTTLDSTVTMMKPPPPPAPKAADKRDAAEDVTAFLWRYRYQMMPIWIMVYLGCTAVILGRAATTRPWWWIIDLAGPVLAAWVYHFGPTRLPRKFRLARRRGQWYAVAAIVAASIWYAETIRHGGTTFHDWMVLGTGTCLGSSGWWHTYRVRGSVPVRVYHGVPVGERAACLDKAREIIADWVPFTSAAGIHGAGIRGITFDEWSVTIAIEMRMGDTLRRMGHPVTLAKIESAYRGRRQGTVYREGDVYASCREGAARVEPGPNGMAHLAVIRIMIRNPHDAPIMPPELGLSDMDDIVIGLFETGDKIKFALVNTIVAGMTDAGKSGVINVVIRALARMRNVAIVGVDLKPGAPEFSPWRDVMHTLATTPAEAAEVFERLIMGLTSRGDEMTRRGWKTWRPTASHPFIVLLVDETQEIMTATINGKRVDLKSPMNRIAAMIRAYGGCLIVATQYPIGPNLSATVKQNAVQRVGLRTGDDQADRVIFGNKASQDQYTPSKIRPGWPGLLFIRNREHAKPVLGRAFYVPEDLIPDEVERFREHRTMIDPDTWAMIDGGPVVPVELPEIESAEDDPEIVDAVIVDGPQDLILSEIGTAGEDGARVSDLVTALGMSRATIYRHLTILQETGQIAPKGRGRFVRS